MRAVPVLTMLVALAACDPVVPESGVGFGDYSQYLRDRERALAGGTLPPAPAAPIVAPVTAPATGFSTDRAAAAIAAAEGRTAAVAPLPAAPGAPLSAATLDPTDPNRLRGNAPAGIRTESGEVQTGNSATISDEQDFEAVAARETIASDAERIARNRAQYQVVQPTALPQRTGGGPNIVAFALSTNHAPGTPMYRRSGFGGNGSGCARYGSTDLAQEAFLSEGGPERDRKGLDPDGDGFACGWDPRPFRAAKQ